MATDTEERFDFNNDVPRPDGFVPPKDLNDWKTPNSFNVANDKCVNGYSGVSTLAARSDHVHPCNIDPRRPERIGVPSWLYTNEFLHLTWDNISGFNGGFGGWYGRVGNPTDENRVSNMYSLSNHVHSYTFIDNIKRPQGSQVTSTELYKAVPDGSYLKYGMELQSAGSVGKVDVEIDTAPLTNAGTQRAGYDGKIPFPARFDHSHPLNLIDIHSSSATGNNVKNYVKPVSFDASKSMSGYGASYGTSRFYARVDHTHPLPVDGLKVNNADATLLGKRYYSDTIANNTTPKLVTSLGTGDNRYIGSSSGLTDAQFKATWERDSSSNTQGFKINVVSFVGKNSARPILYFRELTFDKYGLCRKVSAPLTESIQL